MLTINLDEIHGTENFEIWVAGKRRITISVNEKNLSLQIPGGINPESISNSEGSFFLRTKEIVA